VVPRWAFFLFLPSVERARRLSPLDAVLVCY